jgi:putative pyruvate formate lyase activating enzyme
MLSRLLQSCVLCGHRCGVDRPAGQKGKCRAGIDPVISSYCVHRGEEPLLSGSRGSGTIFFANCCLKCAYCQNYEISQSGMGDEVSGVRLAEIMLELQGKGVHNINLVSPTHYAPQIAAALISAKQQGLKLPIVYNTGGYDSLELLRELDGLVDIYLPDLKYWDAEPALQYSQAENYPDVARAGVAEMLRQVGNIVFDEEGVARKGVVVRHLVLPNGLAGSEKVLGFLAALSKELWISLMAQYNPQHRASEYPELARSLGSAEYRQAVAAAEQLGLNNVYVQELESSEVFLPDFKKVDPFLPSG